MNGPDKIKIDWSDLKKPEVEASLEEKRKREAMLALAAHPSPAAQSSPSPSQPSSSSSLAAPAGSSCGPFHPSHDPAAAQPPPAIPLFPQGASASPFSSSSDSPPPACVPKSHGAGAAREKFQETREYGRIQSRAAAADWPLASIWRQVFFSPYLYMTGSGMLSGAAGWGIAEVVHPWLIQPGNPGIALVYASIYFAIAGGALGFGLNMIEKLVEGASRKAWKTGQMGLWMGACGGAIAGIMGQMLFGGFGAKSIETRQRLPAVALVLDISGSMSGAPLEEMKRAASDLIANGIEKKMALGIVTFSNDANLAAPLRANPDRLSQVILGLDANGGTNIEDGILKGMQCLEPASGPKTIILFTDGLPNLHRYNKSRPTQMYSLADGMAALQAAKDQAELARQQGIRLIALGAGHVNRAFLEDIAGDRSLVFMAGSNLDDQLGGAGGITHVFRQAQQMVFSGQSPGQASEKARFSWPQAAVRSLSWGLIGALIGLTQGLAIRSGKKARSGLLGGLLGGLVGGGCFDAISLALQSGWASRLVSVSLLGALTGTGMGIAENILREAWLYVLSGPFAGKQFILYRNPTQLGSSLQDDIYLYGDEAIIPQHAAIQIDYRGYTLVDGGSAAGILINSSPALLRHLRNGDMIQVGSYLFRYSERSSRLKVPAETPADESPSATPNNKVRPDEPASK